MRTTIRLDGELLKEAKSVATASGKTLNEVIQDALRDSLFRRRALQKRERVSLPTFKPTVPGLQPGVDLNDTAGLLDILDRDDASN